MPAGLKAYWARKRRGKSEAQKPAATPAVESEGPHPDAHGGEVPLPGPPQAQSQSAAQVQPAANREAHQPEGLHLGPDSAGGFGDPARDGQAGAHRSSVTGWPFELKIYGPDGYLLHHCSLYEFLQSTYHAEWTPDEFRFEELSIVVDGSPLLPRAQGHA